MFLEVHKVAHNDQAKTEIAFVVVKLQVILKEKTNRRIVEED